MDASTFFSLGLVIAISVIIEAISLLKNEGRLTAFVGITTFLEMLWVFVCIYALFAISFPAWSILIPAAYLAYFSVAIWNYRGFGKDAETIEDLKELTLPIGFAKISMLVGMLLLLLNGVALLQLT